VGAQPAAAAPAAPEPTGHEDDCEARPGCHDRLLQSLFEEAMGGDAESDKLGQTCSTSRRVPSFQWRISTTFHSRPPSF